MAKIITLNMKYKEIVTSNPHLSQKQANMIAVNGKSKEIVTLNHLVKPKLEKKTYFKQEIKGNLTLPS